ncbi:MAG: CPXCG motif-containing cysteine-rich protein [Candidatus Sericytochromatia bacterium]|nr:CPXCG motif-containing cysteine-rich protein [Candidatus Sericytochromatia bacterium]
MDTTGEYTCPTCGECSVTGVDISQGMSQRLIEDCQVCCRPMTLFIRFDEDDFTVSIEAEPLD